MDKSLLIALDLNNNNNDLKEEIREMILLAETLNFIIEDVIIQKRERIDPSTYFGKGKLETIKNQCGELKINTIFINDELPPTQHKNIQKIFGKNILIIDRTKLILDIFTNHAKTKESKTQVELAKLEYLMPRLTGMWTHLERQAGGTGTRGGPGEKQIEIDRRLINKSINKLKKDLTKIENQKNTQRKSRANLYKIAIVGYTNAGKSSLLKTLTGHNAYIKNQLFATLDTTTKKMKIKNNDVLISDTVGFLRKLPHNLIASFKSTLKDIQNCDLIIKLIDINSTDIYGHLNTINSTLIELKCDKKDSILVFNKIDLIKNQLDFKKINLKYNNPLMISTLKKLKINELLNEIHNSINKNNTIYKVTLDFNETDVIKFIYKKTSVINEKADDNSITFSFTSSREVYDKIQNIRKSSFSEDL